MKTENNDELKVLVRDIVNEYIKKNRMMPVPYHTCQVTEIIIRCGPPDALRKLVTHSSNGITRGGTGPCVPKSKVC